ncbi:MAG: sigma-70 family RNA polymerase sigma factor [Bacteroidota bacterium]|nr:sigma-70 family RNA polymerase sigma factor [Bacteroidota bacterium]MDX5427720.1 sigma-70 family RNA polymerase sigma factor [Bacteroidota bacterium]MDX5505615.1 sigma-70 family RNA polymerase sigma factor [Bacteroidota bacterium]
MNNNNLEKLFTTLLSEYQEPIYWHLRKLSKNQEDANDLTQMTFIKVWEALPNFRGDSEYFTWIYRIATNQFLDHQRTKKFNSDGYDSYQANLLATSSSLDFNGDEIQRKLHAAIKTLPEKQRITFCLRYFDDLDYEQISKITGTSKGALKANYHHAVKKIESWIRKEIE